MRARAIRVVAIAMSLFHLYTGAFGVLDAMLQRSFHLGFAVLLILLIHAHPRVGSGRLGAALSWALGLAIAAGALIPLGYLVVNFDYLTADRIQFVTEVTPYELVFGCALVIALLELCRRVTGAALPGITILFLIFPFIPNLPGIFGHAGYSVAESVEIQYLTSGGIFGVPLGASANFVILFVIFGAFLERSGLGGFIMDFTIGLVGHYRGGPAKVAVLASGITGTISGSAMANVLTVGTITIPLMRRIGYPAFMAGAIEAAASTGGALMPPVMGNVAFIMSEFAGIPYGTIALYAAIPALLYYLGVYCTVHFAAVRHGAVGLPKDELPPWRHHLRERWHLFIPIVLLIYLMVEDYSPQFAAVYSTASVVVISWFRRSTRMGLGAILDALETGAKGAMLVAVATACAGMIVGTFELTSVGVKLAQEGTAIAGTLLAGLIMTMVVSLILGMGVPPSVSYIAQVAVTIPMLQSFLKVAGVDPYVAKVTTHFFVMYYSTLAVLTPPDALASVAAAGLAQSPFIKTALHATRTAFVAFIVPFMFVYRPALLTLGPWRDILAAVGYSVPGVVALACALEGYAVRRLTIVERGLALAAGLMLVAPHAYFDKVGLVIVAGLAVTQLRGRTTSRERSAK